MATNVLLIEDEPMLISLYRLVLEQASYHVDSASDATSAEEKVLTIHPHIVLLDLLIPKNQAQDTHGESYHEPMGFEILRMVKGNPALRGIGVIVLSNLDSDEHVRTAKQLGADLYLVKANLDPHQLTQHVQDVLHRTS